MNQNCWSEVDFPLLYQLTCSCAFLVHHPHISSVHFHHSNGLSFFFFPRAISLVPSLGLLRAQEAPQQIITGFSCGLDIKGASRE